MAKKRERKGPKVQLDMTSIQRTLDALDYEETKRMVYKSLQKGGKTLQKKAMEKMLTKSWKFSPSQKKKGVLIKGAPEYCELIVYPSTFLAMHWLEKGTTPDRQLKKDHPKDDKHPRTLKKGESRGGIKAEPFFSKAAKDTTSVTNAIEQEFDKLFVKAVKEYT